MNTKLKQVFRGKVVNKAHTINTGVDEFPRYVVEYLIDNYCAEETFHQDMEGPSAGVAMVTGIVSALRRLPVRHNLAMTGEITIMGRVLPVGGIQQKVRAAYDAGIAEVLLPADNLKDANGLPASILGAITLTPVQSIDEVLRRALLDGEGHSQTGASSSPRNQTSASASVR